MIGAVWNRSTTKLGDPACPCRSRDPILTFVGLTSEAEAGVLRLEAGIVHHGFDLPSTLCRPVGADLVFEENAD